LGSNAPRDVHVSWAYARVNDGPGSGCALSTGFSTECRTFNAMQCTVLPPVTVSDVERWLSPEISLRHDSDYTTTVVLKYPRIQEKPTVPFSKASRPSSLFPNSLPSRRHQPMVASRRKQLKRKRLRKRGRRRRKSRRRCSVFFSVCHDLPTNPP
jgi:hypothetical protein